MTIRDQLYVAYQAAAIRYGRVSGLSTNNLDKSFNQWYQTYKIAAEKPKQVLGAFGNKIKMVASSK